MAEEPALTQLLLEIEYCIAQDVIDDHHLAGLRAARDELTGCMILPTWKRHLYDATVEAVGFRRGDQRPNTCDTASRMERYDFLVEHVYTCVQKMQLDDDVIALIGLLRRDVVFESKLDYRTSPAGGSLAAS